MRKKTAAVAVSPVAVAAARFAPPLARVADIAARPASERRKSRRFACEGTATVVVLGGALTFTGKIQDLSATGCRLITEVAFTLERGTQVEVLMVVSHDNFRVAAGVRANHKTRGVGLEFMNVSARCALLIQDLIVDLEYKQKSDAPKPTA